MSLVEIQTYEGKKLGRLTVPNGPWAGQQLGMVFYVCDNAACECGDVTIGLANPDQKTIVATFRVDVLDKRRSTYKDEDKHRLITDALIEQFDTADWKSLFDVFSNMKLFMTENLDFEKTKAHFQMAQDIEVHGERVPYSEVLPHGNKLILGEYSNCIIIDEHYCLRSGCDCDSVAVCLIPIKDGKQTEGIPPMIDLHYKTGVISSVDPGDGLSRPAQDVWSQFKEKYPDILSQFSKRHKQLVRLYADYRKRHPTHSPIVKSEKAGRNDPCPCGSGKKFKKCCLQ